MKKEFINQQINKSPLDLFNFFCTNGTYLNVPVQLVFNKVVPLTIGSDILFDSENPEIVKALNEWAFNTKLYEKLKLLVSQGSLMGKSIAFLLRQKKGDLDLYVPQMNYMSSIAKVNEQEKLAVIWTNLNKSDTPSLVKITIGEGKVSIQEFSNPGNLRTQDATARESELTPISNDTYETDVNFFPAFEFVNKRLPDFGMMNSTYFSGLPDWWTGRKLLFDIEESLEQKFSERKKNQTRIFADLDEGIISDLKKQEQFIDVEDIFGDFIIRSTTSSYKTGGGNQITAVQGDPNFETYHYDINQTIKMFYETCGYNYNEKDDTNYENKTKSIMNNDLDIQTTEIKQKELLEGLYKLIDCVLNDKGLPFQENGVRNYYIKFTSSSIVAKVQKMDLIERRIQLGLMSRVEAVQELDNVPKSVAENKVKEIEDDQMARMALENAFNDNDDENGDGESKDGTTKDDSKNEVI